MKRLKFFIFIFYICLIHPHAHFGVVERGKLLPQNLAPKTNLFTKPLDFPIKLEQVKPVTMETVLNQVLDAISDDKMLKWKKKHGQVGPRWWVEVEGTQIEYFSFLQEDGSLYENIAQKMVMTQCVRRQIIGIAPILNFLAIALHENIFLYEMYHKNGNDMSMPTHSSFNAHFGPIAIEGIQLFENRYLAVLFENVVNGREVPKFLLFDLLDDEGKVRKDPFDYVVAATGFNGAIEYIARKRRILGEKPISRKISISSEGYPDEVTIFESFQTVSVDLESQLAISVESSI